MISEAKTPLDDPEVWEAVYQFTGLLIPELEDEAGGFLPWVFEILDDARDTEDGPLLMRAFDYMLDSELSDAELEKIWNSTPSISRFSGEGAHRRFLETCRDYLKTGKYDPTDATRWPMHGWKRVNDTG